MWRVWLWTLVLMGCVESEPQTRLFVDPATSEASATVDSGRPERLASARATLAMSLIDAKFGTLAEVALESATIVHPDGRTVGLDGVYFEDGNVGSLASVYPLFIYGIEIQNSDLLPFCEDPSDLVLRVVVRRLDVEDEAGGDVPFVLNCL